MSKLIENLLKLLEGVPKKWVVFLAFTAIVVGSPNFWPAFSSFVESFEEPKMGQALQLTTDTYVELNRIRVGVQADKVVLLRAHDSGRPRPGVRMQSSIVHEVWDTAAGEYFDRWQNQTLDEPYIQLLQKIYDEGSVSVRTSSMPDSMLRNIYMDFGVQQAEIVRIHTTNKEIFYLGIVWSREYRDLKYGERDVIRSGATRLGGIIAQGEKL